MKSRILFFSFIVLTSVCAGAATIDELNEEWLLREKSLLLQSRREHSEQQYKLIPDTCLTGPLPRTPKTPNYTQIVDRGSDGALKLTYWRERCQVGTGSLLLVRAVPTKGNPYFCSGSLKIIQNALQFNYIYLESTPNKGDWCDDLFVPLTFIVNPDDFGEAQFKPAKALTVIYDSQFVTTKKLEIPTAGAPIPSINGFAEGYTSYRHTCKNISTGEVKSFPSHTDVEWNCNGLTIKSGDTVQTIIKGIAK